MLVVALSRTYSLPITNTLSDCCQPHNLSPCCQVQYLGERKTLAGQEPIPLPVTSTLSHCCHPEPLILLPGPVPGRKQRNTLCRWRPYQEPISLPVTSTFSLCCQPFETLSEWWPYQEPKLAKTLGIPFSPQLVSQVELFSLQLPPLSWPVAHFGQVLTWAPRPAAKATVVLAAHFSPRPHPFWHVRQCHPLHQAVQPSLSLTTCGIPSHLLPAGSRPHLPGPLASCLLVAGQQSQQYVPSIGH